MISPSRIERMTVTRERVGVRVDEHQVILELEGTGLLEAVLERITEVLRS